jgi:hypothetical protein
MSLPFMRKLNPFKPTDIAGCQLWLDSTDSSTVSFSSGSNVSQWRDKSGSSNHFSITNGTTSYISDNGMSVISFPSGAIMSSANQITFTTSSAFYIVSRINSITGAGIGMLLGFTNINGADKSIRLYVSGTIGISLLGTAGVGDGNELANNNYFVNGSFNPSFGSNAYLNVYSIIGTVAPQSGGTSFLTFSSSFLSRFFIGNIAEFIYYPAGITNRQRLQIEGYLAQKWGLQGSLPAGTPGRTGVIYPRTLLIDSLTTGQPTRKPFIRPLPDLKLPSNTITNGLVAYFLFNGSLLDSQNTITLSRTGSTSYVTGLRQQAIYLANETQSSNGTTALNYLTSSYNVTVPFSVAVWFNPTNITRGSILSTVNSTGITGNSVNLYILGAGGGISAAYNAVQNVGAYRSISVGTWYSAVITVNASNGLSLFVNGTQVGSTITQTPSINGLMIGNIQDNGGSYAYSGYLEDYRFYNRVLSGSEITSIYNGTG